MPSVMAFIEYSTTFTIALFFLMLACLEIGRRIGRRRARRDPEGWQAGTGVIEGAMFALLGLMLGFTFSAAIVRVDVRRQQIVAEANAIGTAYLRLDLLPEREQPELRDTFRQYTDARLSVYASVSKGWDAVLRELDRANELQGELWRATVRAAQQAGNTAAPMLLLPAVNELIDITAVRTMAAQTHNPPIFYALIAFLLVITSLLAGYAMARSEERNWLHLIGFAVITTAVVYVILDVDYPRIGLFRMDRADQVLYDVRASMK